MLSKIAFDKNTISALHTFKHLSTCIQLFSSKNNAETRDS